MSPSDSPFSLFKDSLARRLISIPGFVDSADSDSDDSLDDYTSYLASEAWSVLPEHLQSLSPFASSTSNVKDDTLAYVDSEDFTRVLDATPTSFVDSLVSLGVCSPDDVQDFLRRTVSDYVSSALVPLPAWSKTRTSECEICEREVPLTYHHLIPRETHDKVKKRGWHPEEMLNSVAWLCRYVSLVLDYQYH
jgi:hypothetical protein